MTVTSMIWKDLPTAEELIELRKRCGMSKAQVQREAWRRHDLTVHKITRAESCDIVGEATVRYRMRVFYLEKLGEQS